jgi:hypothetical protein
MRDPELHENGWRLRSRMRRAPVASVSALLVVLALSNNPAAGQRAATALAVEAQVPKGVYYVGQAIELRVGIEAAGERPQVVVPRVADAEVTPFRTDKDMLQRGATGIGEFVSERIYYVFRFRIVAKRAGVLQIPPVTARLGERSGASPPLQVPVRALPATGRPAAFLGGVGWFDQVDAEVQPETVRAGQDFEYRIRLLGPAARGSTRPPTLAGLDGLPIALEVEPLPDEVVADPPSRVFRFRLRPTRAGEAVLPPVAIAYFEPRLGQYQTRATPGVPVRVVDVAAFDPSSLAYDSSTLAGVAAATATSDAVGQAAPERRWAGPWFALLSGLIVVLGLCVALLVGRRVHRRRLADPAQLARRVARQLDPEAGAEASSVRITAELARYLNRATGRPEGVLTPRDARSAFERLACNAAIADRAERLVAACDQVRYAAHGNSAAAHALVAAARPLFTDLGRLSVPASANQDAVKHRGRHPEPAVGDSSLPPDDEQIISRYLR